MEENVIVKPWSRIAILIIALLAMVIISYINFGSFLPTNPKDALVFQNALLLIVFGSAILEYKFTKPADSLVNSLMGIITLFTVYGIVSGYLWWAIMCYCLFVLILSTICVTISTGPLVTGTYKKIADLTYQPAVTLGKARIIFSIIFLFGVLSFYEVQSIQTLSFLLFWAIFIVIWPLKIPELLSSFSKDQESTKPIGIVLRTDWPNMIQVSIEPDTIWNQSSPKIYHQANGKQMLILPLHAQIQDEKQLGTAICINEIKDVFSNLKNNYIYEHPNTNFFENNKIEKYLDGDETSKLIGFTTENCSIQEIHFETLGNSNCYEGMLVWCKVGENKVFYQITNGSTKEESLHTDKHGYHIAYASQLGIADQNKGFLKNNWLPTMNTAVFSEPEDFGEDLIKHKEKDFIYGSIPGTKIKVGGPFAECISEHTAILGITGSGKTELAFDLIEHAIKNDVKVICIDLTSQYIDRLSKLTPFEFNIGLEKSKELSEKLHAVDIGTYGAKDEKKDLYDFINSLSPYIESTMQKFIQSSEENRRLGIITLDEIYNTQATLRITELYLTSILQYAKNNKGNCPNIMIAVEEAHTVMPESSTMGLSDFESKALVSKISQIALQGRKYGVGLLVITQRTATVSKSILTQCNSIISFSCIDDTSLSYLSNFIGDSCRKSVPNLRPLQAVIYGKGIKSERPIIIEIPYDKSKDTKI